MNNADTEALRGRENLRQAVIASVAKSGSGALLVSACTVGDLFTDYGMLLREVEGLRAERDSWRRVSERLEREKQSAESQLRELRERDEADAARWRWYQSDCFICLDEMEPAERDSVADAGRAK